MTQRRQSDPLPGRPRRRRGRPQQSHERDRGGHDREDGEREVLADRDIQGRDHEDVTAEDQELPPGQPREDPVRHVYVRRYPHPHAGVTAFVAAWVARRIWMTARDPAPENAALI